MSTHLPYLCPQRANEIRNLHMCQARLLYPRSLKINEEVKPSHRAVLPAARASGSPRIEKASDGPGRRRAALNGNPACGGPCVLFLVSQLHRSSSLHGTFCVLLVHSTSQSTILIPSPDNGDQVPYITACTCRITKMPLIAGQQNRVPSEDPIICLESFSEGTSKHRNGTHVTDA